MRGSRSRMSSATIMLEFDARKTMSAAAAAAATADRPRAANAAQRCRRPR